MLIAAKVQNSAVEYVILKVLYTLFLGDYRWVDKVVRHINGNGSAESHVFIKDTPAHLERY